MTTLLPSTAISDPHVFLVGRPPVGEFLGFVRTMAIDGQAADLGDLTAEWRAANDHVLQIEAAEAGAADNPMLSPLRPGLIPLSDQVLADEVYRRAYRFVPSQIMMVNLDQLVVFQKYINLSFVEELKRRLGDAPSDEDIFRLALPLKPDRPQFRQMQNNQNTFTFVSTSTDFRFLEVQLIEPGRIPGLDSTGRPVAVLALSIGHGSNFLNALHVENRLVLGNGSHRAYALRELGVRSIPCLVQHVTRRDELELIASGEFATNPDRYLRAARPPMLKDYFDERLRSVVQVHRKSRVVRLQFGFEQSDVPD